jgi:hypothetical protein
MHHTYLCSDIAILLKSFYLFFRGLNLGRINAMGRFETDIQPEPDRKEGLFPVSYSWSEISLPCQLCFGSEGTGHFVHREEILFIIHLERLVYSESPY